MKLGEIKALEFLDLFRPHPFQPRGYCSHLEARGGRTYGDRCGFRGWSSGKRSPVVFGDAFAAAQGRFPATWDEALAAEDRRTRQVWAEIARTVRKVR
ncbi:hypothetical protein ASD79_15970 [Caulobacter sp. Root655]|nr:hypothetical protein ASD79_15970 [Caulobacter sp. Root655]